MTILHPNLTASSYEVILLSTSSDMLFANLNLEWVRKLYSDAQAMDFSLLRSTDPGLLFQPAKAYMARTRDGFAVFADITDNEPYNPVGKMNEDTFLLGDTFEIFFQVVGSPYYFELHVTPENIPLQLKWPYPRPEKDPQIKKRWEPWLVWESIFKSKTWKTSDGWSVLAFIPNTSLSLKVPTDIDLQIHFSFSRYDYVRGTQSYIISSSSSRTVDLHAIKDWTKGCMATEFNQSR